MKRYLENLEVGETRISEPYTVSKDEIVKFAKVSSGDVNFATRASFNVWAVIITIILIALYWIFW